MVLFVLCFGVEIVCCLNLMYSFVVLVMFGYSCYSVRLAIKRLQVRNPAGTYACLT